MLYALSAYTWDVAEPANFLMVLLTLGTMGLWFGWRHARAVVSIAVLALLAISILPIGDWVYAPLEDRFPQPPLPQHVDGIILLGGAVNLPVTRAHGEIGLTSVGERIVAILMLANHYPTVPVLVAGGDVTMAPGGITDAEATRRVLVAVGFDAHRLLIEDSSRNTWENAVNAKRVAAPQPGQVWLLVTSAFHMPRAVGCFRQAGFDALPYPVDYHTGDNEDALGFSLTGGFRLLDLGCARMAWATAAYRLLGRSDALFPGPLAATSSSSAQ